jgi:hypothetical protein
MEQALAESQSCQGDFAIPSYQPEFVELVLRPSSALRRRRRQLEYRTEAKIVLSSTDRRCSVEIAGWVKDEVVVWPPPVAVSDVMSA